MIKYLQKVFNVEKEPEMAQEETQAPMLAVDRTAELELAQASLADVQTKYAELSAQLETAQAALAVIEADKAQMVAQAAEAKLAARKEKVEATLGTAKAEGVLAATATLEDAAFEAVLSAFAASYADEAKSPMFNEVGVAAEAAVASAPEESLEMKIIKAKQQKSN
jgi:hypothetical protein